MSKTDLKKEVCAIKDVVNEINWLFNQISSGYNLIIKN